MPDQGLQTPVKGWLRHAEQQSVLFDINGFRSATRQIDFSVRRVEHVFFVLGQCPKPHFLLKAQQELAPLRHFKVSLGHYSTVTNARRPFDRFNCSSHKSLKAIPEVDQKTV